MANIKNFGIIGIGADVQFGKGGARLIQTSGTFAAKDSGGASFVRFQVADGADVNDAVTLNQLNTTVNAAVANISSNLGSISTEVDAIEAGAGLNSDGTYTAPTSALLGNATSIANATELLDAALAAETAARVAGEGTLTGDIANTNSDVSSLSNEVDLIETSVGLQPDGTLILSAGNYLANAVDLVTAIGTLDGVLGNTNADVSGIDGRLTTVEGTLVQVQSDLSNTNANVASLSTEIGGFDANISALQTSFTQLRTDVDSNSALLSATISNVATLDSGLAQEITDRANAVADLQGKVDAANAAVSQESTDRSDADAALQTQIDSNASLLATTAADLSALTANAVLKDGSVVMTGTLQMGNNGISGVGTPVNPEDAANKSYVDTAIGTLAGAFEYKGTVTPGADIGNAALLPIANAGAYYKALNTGYLIAPEANSVAFPVEQNDGVVRNTNTDGSDVGGTWDVIAHVDSTVAGTPGEIVVTGSVDTGYTVSIDGAYTAARYQDVSDEANARIAADSDLQGKVDAANAAISQEVSDRANAVTGLQTQIDSNAALLANTVSSVDGLQTQIDSNAALLTATISNVTTLQGEVVALRTDVDSNSALLSNTITDVAALRTDVDSNAALLANTVSSVDGLQTQIDSNAALLSNTITDVAALRTDVDSNSALLTATISNVSVLQGDVSNLSTELDAVEVGAGLNGDGTYTANATNHYTNAATSLANADDLLDAAVFSVQTALSNLSQDKIVSLDGLTEVKAANTGVQFFGNVGGVMTQTGEILVGANTNTAFQADLTNSDEIILKATGTSSDVDLRLIAQGDGHVIIGETGVGFIQADNGYDMTVAGGIGGGNLNLLGSLVNIGGEDATTVAQFASVTNAVTYATVTNGVGDVTFGANSATATNIDLVFAPKGAGVVNVSNARVINVANAVSSTDAVNLQQMTTAIATSEVGLLASTAATITEANGVTTLSVISGTAIRARVLVTGTFGPNATLTVGSAEGSANELVGVDDTDLSSAYVFVVETAKVYTSGTIQVTIAGADPAGTGSAQVLVEYIKS